MPGTKRSPSKRAPKRPSKPADEPGVTGGLPKADAVAGAGVAPASPIPAGDPRFSVGTWKGLPNYLCSGCEFSTVDEVRMLQHWQAEHAQPVKRGRIIDTGLVDQDGTKLTRVEVPAEED